MNDKTTVASSGVGLDIILFVVFLVLKLCNIIDWSWWWVTAPLWIPVVLFVGVFLVVFVIAFCVGIIKYIVKRNRGKE